ncbi:MAG: DUF86 domain-containing protein [Holophagales bacterium]|nr:DUF86 domain-containing protein [Holophagales bacterium]
MVDLEVVTSKLAELVHRLERVRAFCPETAEELGADEARLDLVSFNLMLGVQACLDIASHCIADEGWPPVSTSAESMHRLHEHGVIARDVAQAVGKAAGLRDLIAHAYGKADIGQIHNAARYRLGDLEAFAAQVGSWLRSRAAARLGTEGSANP